MAANLVSVVMQFLTPEMIGKIASALGLDRNIATKAIAGAVPALLSTLADVAATPNGARQLTNAVTQQQSGGLDALKNLIGGSGQGILADTGSGTLSGLFGGGTFDTIAQSIGKFAGLDGGSSKALLGMLGPVVLGALGQQQRSGNLDASGLASLLGSQKNQIAAAIPSGLADHLSAAGLIDSATDGLRSGAAAGSRAITETSRSAYAASEKASSQWPYWVAALVLAAGVAWFVGGRSSDDTVAEASPPVTTPRPAGTVGMAPNPVAADVSVGGVNLANQLTASVGTLRTVLPTITDAASAQAALPRLREATAQLSEVSSLAATLRPEGKSALAKVVATSTPAINEMLDKVLATPGVGLVAKPTIDDIRSKLDALSRA